MSVYFSVLVFRKKPLTSSERTRRYREKLKRECPEKYYAQKLKNSIRTKLYTRSIRDMTPSEAEAQRKRWRETKCRGEKVQKGQ